MAEDSSSPLSTGYNTRSGSEELLSEPGASLRDSRELLASGRPRMRTASELLFDRCVGRGPGAWAGTPRGTVGLSLVPLRRLHIPELEEAERFEQGQGRALRLLRAAYQCVAAHSELLCYFVIILNHMVTASAASLVLPVLVFLWAMLSIPRPSKRFWMTAIIFTEVGPGRPAGGAGAAWSVLTPVPTGHRGHQVPVPVRLLPLEQPRGAAALREQALLPAAHPGPGEE